jgi:hypothetical protein
LQTLRHTVWLKRHFPCERRQPEIVEGLLGLENATKAAAFPRPDLSSAPASRAIMLRCGYAVPARAAYNVDSLAIAGFGFQFTANPLSPSLETTFARVPCCACGAIESR